MADGPVVEVERVPGHDGIRQDVAVEMTSQIHAAPQATLVDAAVAVDQAVLANVAEALRYGVVGVDGAHLSSGVGGQRLGSGVTDDDHARRDEAAGQSADPSDRKRNDSSAPHCSRVTMR
jgi:hypothetical protein